MNKINIEKILKNLNAYKYSTKETKYLKIKNILKNI